LDWPFRPASSGSPAGPPSRYFPIHAFELGD
jgi:hypothetical protein